MAPPIDILVSFCNVQVPGQPVLGLLDTATSSFRVVRLDGNLPQPAGITGLAASANYIYAALQTSPPAPSELLVLDREELKVLNHYRFRSVVDVHSVWVSGDILYAVSTGTDEVVELRLRGCEVLSEGVRWRPEWKAARADIHHLNAIYGWRGDLLVSGFGKKAGERWHSATAGFIDNITRGERLAGPVYHPHSVVASGDTVVYCESSQMALRRVGDDRAVRLPGYTRGLCLIAGKLFAATSVGRRVSKSTGAINNAAESGLPDGRCTLSRVAADSLDVEETVDLSPYGAEIYDLLPVASTSTWPILPEGAGRALDPVEELAALIPPGDAFILVDDYHWGTGEVLAGRCRIPFMERDGHYRGPPADDATAVRELERLRRSGASFCIFAWPALWWLDYYAGFRQHLYASFPCVLANERLVVFDLRG
jgi:hypothetical protein